MGNKFDEPEFWLPAEFLTDDDILMGHGRLNKDMNLCFPTEFPYDFGPPVMGSPVGSTETESDNEGSIAVLTHQLTRTSLNSSNLPQKSWVHSGSPQSTLTQIGSWSGQSSGSSNGSPNGSSSPPTTPLGSQSDTWNLIYQAAGQVSRMKMHGSSYGPTRNQGIPRPTRSFHPSAPMKTPSSCFINAQFEQVRREQMARQQSSGMLNRQAKHGWFNEQSNRGVRVCNSGQRVWSGMPFEQQNQYRPQYGSAMRAGYPGGSGKKRECAGTGVFLPRRYCSGSNQNPSSDSRRKPGSSTAWLPARVFQSLNEKTDEFNGVLSQPQHQPQRRFNSAGSFLSDYDILVARHNALLAQQRRNLQLEGSINLEVRLPQEWSY